MFKTKIKKSKIPNAGRGVFALKDIKKGEIIERLEVIPIPKKEIVFIEKTVLRNYYYAFNNRGAIACGHGSLYNNNATSPNANVRHNKRFIVLHANRKIKKGEEITFNYGY